MHLESHDLPTRPGAQWIAQAVTLRSALSPPPDSFAGTHGPVFVVEVPGHAAMDSVGGDPKPRDLWHQWGQPGRRVRVVVVRRSIGIRLRQAQVLVRAARVG